MRSNEGVALDGSWEQPGRNSLWTAIAGPLICGALYSTLGGLVISVVMAVASSHDWSWTRSRHFVDLRLSYFQRFQVPILAVTAVMEFAIFFGLTFSSASGMNVLGGTEPSSGWVQRMSASHPASVPAISMMG